MGNRQAVFGFSIALILAGVSGARSTVWGAPPGVQPSRATGLLTDRLSAAQLRKWQAIVDMVSHQRALHPTLGVAGRKEADAGQTAHTDAIGRAVRLLSRQPVAVVLADRDRRSHSRTGKARVDAFVNHRDPVVYVVRNGVCLQAALKGPGIYDYVLAIVIWHEWRTSMAPTKPRLRKRRSSCGSNSFSRSVWTAHVECSIWRF
jgi:hypothetical protein